MLRTALIAGLQAVPAVAAPLVFPGADPATAKDPHLWLNYIGYIGEFVLFALALVMILGTIDLCILRKWAASAITFGIALLVAIVGLALPGLCIMADREWAHSDSARFAYVSFFSIGMLVVISVFCLSPILAAIVRKQEKLFIWIVVVAALLSSVLPIAWLLALHFAFWTRKKTSSAPAE